jgi:hypothetical protein
MPLIAAPIAAVLTVTNSAGTVSRHFAIRNRASAAYAREKIVALFSTLMSFFS